MGDGQRLTEFKFKITEPANRHFCTIIELVGFQYRSGNTDMSIAETVIQLHWWPWYYRRNIEIAKKKVIRKYFQHVAEDRSWIEGAGGEYKNDIEKEML